MDSERYIATTSKGHKSINGAKLFLLIRSRSPKLKLWLKDLISGQLVVAS